MYKFIDDDLDSGVDKQKGRSFCDWENGKVPLLN